MFCKVTIKEFLKRLSAKTSTPGGGSVAALAGAQAAGLIVMVAKFSGNRKIAKKAERFMNVLRSLITKDADAYEEVAFAYKLPKKTRKEKKVRKEATEKALKQASEVPLQTARYSYEIIKLAEDISKSCNLGVLSDVGVAVLVAAAAVEGALLNVKVNLDLIKDEDFKKEIKKLIKKEPFLAGYRARKVIGYLGQRYSFQRKNKK